MPGTPTRVLIIDDEPAICKALSIGLARAGFYVKTALTGDEGIALIKKEPFDVLVLDLRVHDMRGDVIFELARAEQPNLAHTTLFVTGDISERADRLIRACGCPLLRKPFELRDLIGVLTAMMPRAKDASA
ncbi:MAG: response regulator [Gemmatimonadota bacterium]|nr:response regulator [Gemmatimonadota bacterium]